MLISNTMPFSVFLLNCWIDLIHKIWLISHCYAACSISRAWAAPTGCRWKPPSLLLRQKHPTSPADLIRLSNHGDLSSSLAGVVASARQPDPTSAQIPACHSWTGRQSEHEFTVLFHTFQGPRQSLGGSDCFCRQILLKGVKPPPEDNIYN